MAEKKSTRAVVAARQKVKTQITKAAKTANKYLLVIIAVIFALYLYLYPDVLNKMWKGLRSYSGETGSKITFEALFQATLFFLCATYIVRRFKVLTENYLLAKLPMDTGIKHTVITLVNYGVWIFIFLMTLSILGIQLKNLAILFGALSVGIGFGLQNIVNNFVSGIIILLNALLRKGIGLLSTVRKVLSGTFGFGRPNLKHLKTPTFLFRMRIFYPDRLLIGHTQI